MEADEIFVAFFALVIALMSMGANATSWLPPLYFRNNPGVGLVRLSIVAGMLWSAFVLFKFADESVTGIYIAFYLLLAFAAIKAFGQTAPRIFRINFRVDVCERKNFAAALALAGFILATGIIFGGSLWGEADPDGDDEGGWWIPVGFFLAGWIGLAVSAGLYLLREPARIHLRRRREVGFGASFAVFVTTSGILIHEGVAGDFYGWAHGLLSVGAIIVMLCGHELISLLRARLEPRGVVQTPRGGRRLLETVFYLFIGTGTWFAHRWIDLVFGPGA